MLPSKHEESIGKRDVSNFSSDVRVRKSSRQELCFEGTAPCQLSIYPSDECFSILYDAETTSIVLDNVQCCVDDESILPGRNPFSCLSLISRRKFALMIGEKLAAPVPQALGARDFMIERLILVSGGQCDACD